MGTAALHALVILKDNSPQEGTNLAILIQNCKGGPGQLPSRDLCPSLHHPRTGVSASWRTGPFGGAGGPQPLQFWIKISHL